MHTVAYSKSVANPCYTTKVVVLQIVEERIKKKKKKKVQPSALPKIGVDADKEEKKSLKTQNI